MLDWPFVVEYIRAPQLAAAGSRQSPAKVALGAAVACAEQDTGAFTATDTKNGRYFRVQCDAAFTIAFGPTGMGAPVVGTEWPLQANTVYEFSQLDATNDRFFRAISTPGGNLFWYL